jgi:hypothetical protein
MLRSYGGQAWIIKKSTLSSLGSFVAKASAGKVFPTDFADTDFEHGGHGGHRETEKEFEGC